MIQLAHDSFPRASRYSTEWLLSLDMGPHPLWLLEELLESVEVRTGARVLDLGCGRGATSVFLAKEFGAEVWAVDLWIPVEEIERTVVEAGVEASVQVFNADARNLPFEDEFFDVIVSIDAWEYFGTDDHFLPGLLRKLKPGGRLGVATPGMLTDVRELGYIPEHIASAVGWEALAWHSPEWWEKQWELTGLVAEVSARAAKSGWDDWLRWSIASAERSGTTDDVVVDMLRKDAGELLTFALLSATKK